MTILLIIGIVVLVFYPILTYNGLVKLRNRVEYAYSSIEVMLKKRHDLIPNLVASVKQYMQHERSMMESITELRTRALQSGLSRDDKIAVEGQLSDMLGRLMVAVENYPDLKADRNVAQLQASLNDVEEQISAARRSFNAAILGFNQRVESFPASILATMFGFSRMKPFEADPVEKRNVDVGDLFNR